MSIMVENFSGTMVDFEVAVELMNPEIREIVHNGHDYRNEQEFFSAYEMTHAVFKGEDWELSKSNPVY